MSEPRFHRRLPAMLRRVFGGFEVMLTTAMGCLVALFLVTADVSAQDGGTLTGRVIDRGTGAPIAGVDVQVANTRMRTTTDVRGGWHLGGLVAGTVRLRFEHVGYAAYEVTVAVPSAEQQVSIALTPVALPLNELIVTAARRAQPLADAVVATELISRRAIEHSRISDLSTLLFERAGIQVEGGHPVGEGIMLQGLGSERVLVMLDGQPVIGRLSGQIDLSRFPTSMVERIEIVKGPQSSLYGSEAMGGVVNVITRRAAEEPWSASADATAGSQGRLDVSSSVRGTLSPMEYLVDAGRRTAELTPGHAEEHGARALRYDGLVKLAWSIDSTTQIGANVILVDEQQRWRTGQLYQFSDNRQWSARIDGVWRRPGLRLSPVLYLSEFEHLSRRATSPTPLSNTGDRELQRLWEAELLVNAELFGTQLDGGVEAKRDEIRSDRVEGHDRALHTLEPFAQLSWRMDKWTLVPGARLSWSEQWGAHLTPSISTLYRPTPALALRGSVGQGYRAPSFKELYMEFLNIGSTFAYAVRGNPDLRPETSTNVSLGAEWSHRVVYVRTSAYYNNFEQFIETRIAGDSSGVTLNTYDNIASGYTRGVELDAGASYLGARVSLGYAYLDTRDRESDTPLLGRPAHSARAALEYTLPFGLTSAANLHYTGETPVVRTDSGVVMREAFHRLDLRFSQRLIAGTTVAFGARNVFDARPDEWPGFTGRQFYVGISWQGAHARDFNNSTPVRNNHD